MHTTIPQQWRYFMRALRILAVLIFLASHTIHAFGQTKAIKFGKLVDGRGKVLSDAVVVIEKDRIKSVGPSGSTIPAGVEVIDLSRYTGIPGLIDVHTHLAGPASAPGRTPNQQLARHPAIDMFLGQHAAKTMLESGVTTVRNLGAVQFMDIAMRDLINMGAMVGPRMFVSGPGLRTSSALGLVIPEATADSPAEVTRVVRKLIAAGVDYIKVFGSTGNGLDLTGYQTSSFEELKAAADAAHSLGKKVAVHSYGPNGARDAARAGVDSIEHATDMDDATIQEMARRGIFYVPTIDHNRYYLENTARTPEDKESLNDFINRNLETAKRAVKAGVRFGMGSDGGAVAMIGETTRELGWFVKAGMTPEQALMTATANGAALLGKERELGAVAPGYFADIVAVEGDPLKDISVVISNVRWVMKAGAVVVDKTKAGKSN
jgi:imidazolonepropionase-like amidohydrolase